MKALFYNKGVFCFAANPAKTPGSQGKGRIKMLPEKAIKEFKEIYRKNYGIELTDKEASERANNFVALYKAVYNSEHFGRLKPDEFPPGQV
jgi:hypothetical protein